MHAKLMVLNSRELPSHVVTADLDLLHMPKVV